MNEDERKAAREEIVNALASATRLLRAMNNPIALQTTNALDSARRLAAWEASRAAMPAGDGWMPMDSAPKDRTILAVVDGIVRQVRYGKTSHVPMYGFCLADQGVEDFDLCDPTCWMDMPQPPKEKP